MKGACLPAALALDGRPAAMQAAAAWVVLSLPAIHHAMVSFFILSAVCGHVASSCARACSMHTCAHA